MTPQRFAQGMTFDEYVTFVGSPKNLARQGFDIRRFSHVQPRLDWSGFLRERYAKAKLTDAQAASIKWLASQPGGPAKVVVISEEWSSDCRRDVPMLARLAEAGGLDLRIFPRDGQKFSQSATSDPAESPNADVVNELLNEKDGRTFQSVPAAAFLTKDFSALYRYFEFPAIYHKMRLAEAMQVAKPGENREQAWDRFIRDWGALQESPFFPMWASAAIDEMLSALHERMVVGSGPA
jgi:thiol-disulfide isomerase/thioredoxin